MTTPADAQQGFQARAALGWLGGFAAFGVALSGLYATTGFGFGCPFRALTGWDCPLCGGTRLGSSLLHGDLAAAFAYNPVVFVGLAALTVLGICWTIEAAGGPRLRLPQTWGRRLSAVHPTSWLVAGLLAATLYTLLRNLL